jgi:hypothetical protein
MFIAHPLPPRDVLAKTSVFNGLAAGIHRKLIVLNDLNSKLLKLCNLRGVAAGPGGMPHGSAVHHSRDIPPPNDRIAELGVIIGKWEVGGSR